MLPKFVIVIPARYASTRYPGKPLVPLRGTTGVPKSLVQRSWESASAVPGCAGIWVATDDNRIAEEVHRFGGEVVMTPSNCLNGTERCAAAVGELGVTADVIVNLQGDAPLSPSDVVPQLVARLAGDTGAAMCTPAVRCSPSVYSHLAEDAAQGRVGGTTAVFDKASRALYFSKRILPYLPDDAASPASGHVFLHLGLYAYRPEALTMYSKAEPSVLELCEGLEQLRFLDLGLAVSILQLDCLDWDAIELNNPSDVPAIERVLAERGIA